MAAASVLLTTTALEKLVVLLGIPHGAGPVGLIIPKIVESTTYIVVVFVLITAVRSLYETFRSK